MSIAQIVFRQYFHRYLRHFFSIILLSLLVLFSYFDNWIFSNYRQKTDVANNVPDFSESNEI